MARHTAYIFKTPTRDLTHAAQLQEWADYYKVELRWEDRSVQTRGVAEWSTYPVIQEYHFNQFVGKGTTLRAARQVAAEFIIQSNGTLDTAMTLPRPTTISQARW
ncbi:unnamed protein product [Rhizoctonia solani]|uniref:DRBM domain-containing protein n=1 Tax=Rhizoctonia solani TaxID=456999 RepID=A0A8H3AXB8_9AGAM|nr:unnamed protein product [Rhizoctonia solani]